MGSSETGILLDSIQTERLHMTYLAAGNPLNPVIILVHGNVSSSLFWEHTMGALSGEYRVIAPDFRGYGDTEPLSIDATRGLRDWAEDLKSFADALELQRPFHLVGWSLGGGIVMQYGIDHPSNVASMTLINPVSPFGFGGTKDEIGTPNYADYAGSGGGTVNAEYVVRIQNHDRSAQDGNSPRNVMNQFYFRPPFRVDEVEEEAFVTSMLSTKTGEGFYPGAFKPSENWPGVAPGADGIANAMSPKYMNLLPLVEIAEKFPVLWIRGAEDQIVSDQSFLDFGSLGKLGLVPGWPGESVYPPQPMVSQTRYVLGEYRERGGHYEELVVDGVGHSPHIEKPEVFIDSFVRFLKSTSG